MRPAPTTEASPEIYRQVFEEAGGEIVAFEAYTTGETDYTRQLETIKESGAELIFLPNYHNEIPGQVAQAREIGLEAPFLGSDTWGSLASGDLPGLTGYYFSTHYTPEIESDVAQAFIEKYQTAYDSVPDDVAALTYDAFGLLAQAIANQQKADPESIRNGLSSIGRYEGVTGSMEYQGSGDPVKSAVILQVKNDGFEFYKMANP